MLHLLKMSPKVVKEVALTLNALILTALLFWWLSRALRSVPAFWPASLIILFCLIWLAFLEICLALLTNPWAVALLVLVVPTLLLVVSPQIATAITALLLLAGLLYARWQIRDRLHDSLRYRTIPTFFTSSRWLLAALLAAAASLSVSAVADRLRTETVVIPEHYFVQTLPLVRPLLGEIDEHQLSALTATTAAQVNHYLTSVLQSNPELSATAALSAAVLTAHFVMPLLAWPEVAFIALFMLVARQLKIVYVLSYQTAAERISLDKNS